MVSKPKSISEKYLTFVAQANGFKAKLSNNAIEYCIDESDNWVTLAANTYTPAINTGQMISFKANITPVEAGYSNPGIGTFTTTAKYKAMGTPMSLIASGRKSGNDFISKTYADSAFIYLFKNDTYLTEVSDDFLPSTVLGDHIYYDMFYGCTSLTKAPQLPGIFIKGNYIMYAYHNMFYGCTSLKTMPQLLSPFVDSYGYAGMFINCTSLETVYDLPATSVGGYAYQGMFNGCTSLKYAPNIAVTSCSAGCMNSMFEGCTSLINGPAELKPTDLSDDTGGIFGAYQSMFYNCINLKQPPKISARYLGPYSMCRMFEKCRSLTTTPELKIYSVSDLSLFSTFSGCTSITSASNITINTDTSEYSCCGSMFRGCTSLVTGPNILTETLKTYEGYPSTDGYQFMFDGCSSLKYIKAMFLEEFTSRDISDSDCLYYWVNGVGYNGTFVLNSNIEWDPNVNRGRNGIPSGWTIQYA